MPATISRLSAAGCGAGFWAKDGPRLRPSATQPTPQRGLDCCTMARSTQDSGPLDWATTDDPIDVLLGEHRTILRVLDEVERECRRLEREAMLREAFWQDILRFSGEFDAGLHHQKEEQLLFPLLELNGLSSTTGPTAVLRDEHLRCQFWMRRIEQAVHQRDRNRLAAAASSYLDLVRSHILKENQILLPLARRLLSVEQRETLHREFRLLSADQRLSYWLQHPYEAAAADSLAAPAASDLSFFG